MFGRKKSRGGRRHPGRLCSHRRSTSPRHRNAHREEGMEAYCRGTPARVRQSSSLLGVTPLTYQLQCRVSYTLSTAAAILRRCGHRGALGLTLLVGGRASATRRRFFGAASVQHYCLVCYLCLSSVFVYPCWRCRTTFLTLTTNNLGPLTRLTVTLSFPPYLSGSATYIIWFVIIMLYLFILVLLF